MSYNQLLTELEKLLLKYPDKSWNWVAISSNPNITIKFIQEHPDLPWNWNAISYNKFGWKHNRKKTNLNRLEYLNFIYNIKKLK